MASGHQLAEESVPAVLGVVAIHEGDTEHWSRDAETGDVMVSVVTHAHGSPLRALLHGTGGRGVGVWAIPPVGAEVLVVFPDGDFEGDPVLFGAGGAPATLDAATVLVVAPAGGKVVVRQDGGTAAALATKADLDALRAYIDRQFALTGGHVHATPAGPTTTITAAASGAVAPSTPAPTAAGTLVLEAE